MKTKLFQLSWIFAPTPAPTAASGKTPPRVAAALSRGRLGRAHAAPPLNSKRELDANQRRSRAGKTAPEAGAAQ